MVTCKALVSLTFILGFEIFMLKTRRSQHSLVFLAIWPIYLSLEVYWRVKTAFINQHESFQQTLFLPMSF